MCILGENNSPYQTIDIRSMIRLRLRNWGTPSRDKFFGNGIAWAPVQSQI